MNQLFLSNPELIGSIKFTKLEDDKLDANHLLSSIPEPLTDQNDGQHVNKKQGYISPEEGPSEGEEPSKKKSTATFWETISREMTQDHKANKLPTIKRINNVLNIFKAVIEKPEQKYETIDSKPTPRTNSLSAVDGRSLKEKRQKSQEAQLKFKEDESSNTKQTKQKSDPTADDGIVYYSFKKKMQLKLKEKQHKLQEQQKVLEHHRTTNELEGTAVKEGEVTTEINSKYSPVF